MISHLSADYNLSRFFRVLSMFKVRLTGTQIAQISVEHLPKIALGHCSINSSIFVMLRGATRNVNGQFSTQKTLIFISKTYFSKT